MQRAIDYTNAKWTRDKVQLLNIIFLKSELSAVKLLVVNNIHLRTYHQAHGPPEDETKVELTTYMRVKKRAVKNGNQEEDSGKCSQDKSNKFCHHWQNWCWKLFCILHCKLVASIQPSLEHVIQLSHKTVTISYCHSLGPVALGCNCKNKDFANIFHVRHI